MKQEKFTLEEATRMLLSNNNLLKQGQVNQLEGQKEIVTVVKEKEIRSIVFQENSDELVSDGSDNRLKIEQQKIAKLHQDMLVEIEKKAQEIEAQAYSKGYQEGLQSGNEVGYLEGVEKSREAANYYTEIAQTNLQESDRLIQEHSQEHRKQWIQFSVALAEKLTATTIDTKEAVIAKLINQSIEEMNYPQELIIIRVHSTKFDEVRREIQENQGNWAHTKISVLKEVSLSPYDFSIETQEGFTLVDMKAELSTFLQKLVKGE